MADKSFTCKLITPEARILDAEVTYASVPMHDGQRGIMHLTGAIVGKLGPGRLRYRHAALPWCVSLDVPKPTLFGKLKEHLSGSIANHDPWYV